jgi:hypothetical protein
MIRFLKIDSIAPIESQAHFRGSVAGASVPGSRNLNM